MATYRKSRAFAPEGFFECEGRGLEWLGAAHAQGGPRVVQVYGWGKDYLDIERNLIAEINDCRASELIKDKKGNYYISSAGWFDGTYGLKIAPFIWKDGLDNETNSLNP